MPAPIAVFAFNRPDHLRRVLTALAANDSAAESAVTVFCDGPRHAAEKKLTDAVRAVAREAAGFRSLTVVEREKNMGCAGAVPCGVREMFAEHERLVVVEDDVLLSPHALRFLNACLDKYADEPMVFNIAAWSPPPRIMPFPPAYPFDAYFIPRFNGWGWACWRDRWQTVDWSVADYAYFKQTPALQRAFNRGGHDLSPMLRDQMEGRIQAWDIRMDYSRFKQGRLGLNPVVSYATNIGMGSGTHTTVYTARYDNELAGSIALPRLPDHVFMDAKILAAYRRAYKTSLWQRCMNRIRRMTSGQNEA